MNESSISPNRSNTFRVEARVQFAIYPCIETIILTRVSNTMKKKIIINNNINIYIHEVVLYILSKFLIKYLNQFKFVHISLSKFLLNLNSWVCIYITSYPKTIMLHNRWVTIIKDYLLISIKSQMSPIIDELALELRTKHDKRLFINFYKLTSVLS